MYQFVGPARTRVLLVPCNQCSVTQYTRYVDEIRSGPSEVRLLDVSSPTLHHHNPQLFPQGRILYDFVTSDDNKDSLFLHDFEPWRKTFVVVAVGPYSATPSVSIDQLKTQFPSAIVHNIIQFDTPQEEVDRLRPPSDHALHSVFYYSGTLTALETIMCLILANFLAALDSYTDSFQNITLRSPVSISDSNTIARTITSAQKRLSSGSFKVSFNNLDSGHSSPSTESKTRHLGRQKKVLGSFALLAGNYAAASAHFVEAITNLRKVDDNLWLGNALEGLAVAMALLHYVGMPTSLNPSVVPVLQLPKSKLSSDISSHRPSSESSIGARPVRNSHPSIASPRSSINSHRGVDISMSLAAEIIKLLAFRAVHFYGNTLNDLEDTVPDMVYIESMMRSIKFAICIYLGGGDLSVSVLDAVIRGTKLEKQPPGPTTSKSEILKEIDKIFGLQLIEMSISQQCKLYCCLATMYGDLGLQRKQAFLLRTFLVGLLPSLTVKQHQKVDINEYASIRDVFELLFRTYGINADTESSASAASKSATHWTTINLLLLKLALLIGSANNDYPFVIHVCTLLFARFSHCLSRQEQQKIKDKITWVQQRSDPTLLLQMHLSVPYWDPYLVRRVKLVANKKREELIPFSELLVPNGGSNVVENSSADGLIFNPYSREQTGLMKDKVVVRDEMFQLKITMQNPFGFDLQVQDIEIVTDHDSKIQTVFNLTKPTSTQTISSWPNGGSKSTVGSKSMPSLNQRLSKSQLSKPNGFTGLAVNVPRYEELTIPPNSLQTFLVSFKPESVGLTKIRAFDITIANCDKQRFLIVDEEKFDTNLKLKDGQSSRGPTEIMQSLKNCSIDERASFKTLALNIIPPQPILSLTESLIVNGVLMMLEGEKYKFTTTLTNESDHSINYLSFSFWDSTVDNINRQLANAGRNGLLPLDIHNLEWSLLDDKPFRILNKDVFTGRIIEPHAKLEIEFEVNGKRHMRDLKIMLDYANKGKDDSRSFVKLVTIPLQFTVLPSIEVMNFDVVTLNSSSLLDFHLRNLPEDGGSNALKSTVDFLAAVAESGNLLDYCILAIDVRNAWKEAIKFNIDASLPNLVLEGILDPGKTSRVFVPFKRVSWKDIDLTKPIPSLRNKQFVKSKNLNDQEQEVHKKLFWLRAAILDKVRGQWQVGRYNRNVPVRHGGFNLRVIRLEPRMARALMHERVQIQHELVVDDDERCLERVGTHFLLETDVYYTLRTTIVNNLDQSIYGTLRNLPYSLGSSSGRVGNSVGSLTKSIAVNDKKVLVNGVLQSHIGYPGISPHLTYDISTTFVVLEKGEYEWGAILDVFDGNKVMSKDSILLQVN